jgi:lysophospholipase L1-like esterase
MASADPLLPIAPTRPRARRLARCARLVLAFAVVLAAVEVGVRLNGYPRPMPRAYPGEHTPRPSEHFDPDPHLGWRMKPRARLEWVVEGRAHELLSDELGFRIGARELSGTRMLAVLGDSFAWGAGVEFEETFAAQTAERIEWRVRIFGQPGFGVDQIAETLRRAALPERPDLVLVAIYAPDFERSLDAFRVVEGMAKPAHRLAAGELAPRTERDTPHRLWRWLDEHSWALAAANLASRRLAMRWPHGEWWELNRAFVERMIEDCRAANTPLAFVHVPTISWRTFPAFGELCASHGVPWLDPANEWRARPAGAYYPVDKHLTATGHAWFAERLAPWLRSSFPELVE